MKKFALIFLSMLVMVSVFTGCSEKDDPTETTDDLNAYSLDQFVPNDLLAELIIHDEDDDLSWSELFYFWPVADDGFSPRSKGYDDMSFTDWEQGYFIPSLDEKISFPQFTEQNINAYNVKFLENIYVNRGFKVVAGDDVSVLFELAAMENVTVTNYDEVDENAIALSSFIPEHVTAVDSVKFIALDGYDQFYSTDEFNGGYWLVDSQKTIFPGLDLPSSKKKFKFLKTIEFYGTATAIEEFENTNLASTDDADISFTIPEDLTEFESTPWE